MSTNATFIPHLARSPLESFEKKAERIPAYAGATFRGPKPHICFLAPTTWPILSAADGIQVVGGAEVQQNMIAPALAKRGYRVSMICLDYGQPDEVRVKGVQVYKAHKPDEGLPVVRFVYPRLTSLWSAMKRVDADVYYQRTAAVYTGYVAAFCRKHGRRSMYAGASDVDFIPGREDIRYARDRKIFQWGLKRVDRVIAQNAVQADQLREHYGIEGPVIQSCYAPPAGARNDPKGYVLWVASVRPSKRVDLMLEIARRLPQHRFVIIGGPDPDRKSQEYFASVKAIAAQMPNVEMTGFIPFHEAEHYFNGARAFVNTSRYEGFPNTFMQAWARGIPAVGFVDTGSKRDGVPVYDVVSEVNEATWRLDRLMSDDAAWERASRTVRAHFQDCHSVDAVIDRYEEELALLVGDGAR
ncbi:MAG TPA: glycosyltransferase family 4 protein [Usitatibacter sp.]|nr:glycosyltransferase family 4 protein [Usitatibacter sp.]